MSVVTIVTDWATLYEPVSDVYILSQYCVRPSMFSFFKAVKQTFS